MASVEYWPVGQSTASWLPFEPADVSRHLLLDWAPSLPVSLGSSFMGWPAQLLEVVIVPRSGINALAVSEVAGRSERQWKSVLSWMLGIAGARHVLEAERYRWVAPLSAFYENAKQAVDLTGWHPSYPRTVLSISRCPASRSRLRPDYVALRSSGDGADKVEWALVEAKGTKASLVSARCGPGRRVTESSRDMGNTFSHTRAGVLDAVAGDVTHGSTCAIHRGVPARRVRHRGASATLRHQSEDRL